ncbi:hypothetical protein [Microbacterium sp. 18062]|nr:hypothetical protein [Microbacterium sp. 18062]
MSTRPDDPISEDPPPAPPTAESTPGVFAEVPGIDVVDGELVPRVP